MSWRDAAEWASYMFKNINSSIPMPLYGFSLWGIAYLVSKGIRIESIAEFGSVVREKFILGLDDIEMDYSADLARRLADVFKDATVVPAKGINGGISALTGLSGRDGTNRRLNSGIG